MLADPVVEATDALTSGMPVILVGDEGQEIGGDIVLSAALATPRQVAWMVRHSSGLLYVPMSCQRADRLELTPMVEGACDPERAAYTVSVDAWHGISTGISATDRAHTARVLADPETRPSDLVRPGHLLPLRTPQAGMLVRAGRGETAVDLSRAAGLPAVALLAELSTKRGSCSAAQTPRPWHAPTTCRSSRERISSGSGSNATPPRVSSA